MTLMKSDVIVFKYRVILKFQPGYKLLHIQKARSASGKIAVETRS